MVLHLNSAADITVKLRNRGPDAFKPEKYGNSITVQRRLRQDGSGGYNLRNSNGICLIHLCYLEKYVIFISAERIHDCEQPVT